MTHFSPCERRRTRWPTASASPHVSGWQRRTALSPRPTPDTQVARRRTSSCGLPDGLGPGSMGACGPQDTSPPTSRIEYRPSRGAKPRVDLEGAGRVEPLHASAAYAPDSTGSGQPGVSGPRRGEPEELTLAVEPLQRMRSGILEHQARALQEVPGRPGDKHLAGGGERHDSRRCVDGNASGV